MVRLVFDDGGFTHVNPDGTGPALSPVVYDRLAALAERAGVRVGLACTAKYFDVDGLYDGDALNADADRILKKIGDHAEWIEIYNHGLTHEHLGEPVEYFSYESGRIDEATQSQRLSTAQEIWSRVGLRPSVLVPPGHAWERGVTDVVAERLGFEAIAVRQFEKKRLADWLASPARPYKATWKASDHIETRFRLGLGIRFDQTVFGPANRLKLRMIFGPDVVSRLAINRTLVPPIAPSHYFAHVQNLQRPESLHFFTRVLSYIERAHASPVDR